MNLLENLNKTEGYLKMQSGTAKVNITPPIGFEPSGWAFGPSVGVLDDLFGRRSRSWIRPID